MRDPIILCRSIANTKCGNVNNFPRVTEKIILAANDSITVSVLEETFFIFFSNCIRKNSSDLGIWIFSNKLSQVGGHSSVASPSCFEYSRISSFKKSTVFNMEWFLSKSVILKSKSLLTATSAIFSEGWSNKRRSGNLRRKKKVLWTFFSIIVYSVQTS